MKDFEKLLHLIVLVLRVLEPLEEAWDKLKDLTSFY